MTKEKRLVFVYGTLKRGERLNGLMAKQKRLGEAITVDSNYTIKDFLRSYPITFRHFDKKHCKFRIKGELYDIKDDTVYESVCSMELNAGYTLVNTLVELDDGTEHVAEMFLVEETPAKISSKEVLSDFRITTDDNIKEWSTK
jgi:gamma-glutamylcyclotransferase (GGCT)/AIG2-like uncharacterized protein YtfP